MKRMLNDCVLAFRAGFGSITWGVVVFVDMKASGSFITHLALFLWITEWDTEDRKLLRFVGYNLCFVRSY